MHKLGIVVPYRNRKEQLDRFVPYMTEYLTQKNIDYVIIIVDQDDASAFNRGTLCNIGFKEAKKKRCDYVVFHDVDMLPVDVDYSHSDKPIHLASDELPFDTYFGGMTLFPTGTFSKIDGFSNLYWGWGFEDDDLRYRCSKNDIDFGHKVDHDYQFDGKTLIFNGVNSYALVKNNINFLRSFNIEIDLRLGKLYYDHTKQSDKFTIFNIQGYDFDISYTSFKRFCVQFFDNQTKFYQIYSNPIHSSGCRLKVSYDYYSKTVKFFIDNELIGEQVLEYRLKNYKKPEYIFIGCDHKKQDWFKGSIDRLSVSNDGREYFIKHHSSNIDKYTWTDLTNKNTNSKLYNVSPKVYKEPSILDDIIPYRRNSIIKRQDHESNGFIGGRWKSDLTRWNQLRFNNEVLNGVYDETKDGVSSLKYKLHGRKKVNNYIHLNVGI